MIEIRSLTKDYGSFRAVANMNLHIPNGQVLGLLGPNGAGKTTAIRILTGYMPPTSGSITVDGFDSVRESSAVRLRLGYLSESNPLYGEMRVEEYLRFRARLFKIPPGKRQSAVERVVERCWLKEMRRRLIGRLSKGYRQRVGLAAAMLHRPPVLVLDEPTSGLDPVQIRETRHLIRELAGEHTMIISSHILPEVERTVDRIVILAKGVIRADGSVDELRESAGESHHYRIEVKGDQVDGLVTLLKKVSGALTVEEEALRDGWHHVRVASKPGAEDLRETIGRGIHENNLVCRELMREAGSLEHLFVRIAMGDGAYGAGISETSVNGGGAGGAVVDGGVDTEQRKASNGSVPS